MIEIGCLSEIAFAESMVELAIELSTNKEHSTSIRCVAKIKCSTLGNLCIIVVIEGSVVRGE